MSYSQSFGPSAIVSGSTYLLLRLSALECLTSLADGLTCRVGRGGAYRPASARSLKRLVQFSRKPLSYVGRADWRRLGRIPGTRWISRTRPKSAMRHEDGYRRHAVFRHRLLMKDHSRRSIHPSSLWNSFRTFAFR